MTHCVFDVETTYGEDLGRKSNPFLEKNELVVLACRSGKEPIKVSRSSIPKEIFKANCLIGHNLKFDLLWLMRYAKPQFLEWLKHGGTIWDTMLAEYMLHGHLKIGYKLDQVALRYGGVIKDDRIQTMWKGGIQTKDIPADIMDPYVITDVRNTYKIACAQIKKARELGTEQIIKEHQRGILFTLLCEHNGAKVCLKTAEKIRDELIVEYNQLSLELNSLISKNIGIENKDHINLKSVDHLSALLYGGQIKINKRLPVIDPETNEPYIFKTGAKKGQIKETWQQVILPIRGFGLERKKELKAKKEGNYKTGFKILLDNRLKVKFIDVLLNFRKVSTLLSTYVSDVGGSVVALTHPDGCVHASFNHCITATGRLSCRKPNIQNIEKRSPLKKIFITRFNGGKIVQFDFSQLELKTLGFHTQDKALLSDIYLEVDGYVKTLAEVEGIDYRVALNKVEDDPVWKEKRQLVKSVVLGLNYGMGKFKTAEMLGVDTAFVEEIISARNKAYPQVNLFNTRVLEIIKNNILDSSEYSCYNIKTESGLPAKIGQWRDPLGAIFNLVEKDSPDFLKEKGIMTSFPPTQSKNFPQQGMAAHINVMSTGIMLRKIAPYLNYILPINVVHDDQKYDCHSDYIDLCVQFIREMVVELPTYISETFNVDFNVPLNGEISVGDNWKDLEKIN